MLNKFLSCFQKTEYECKDNNCAICMTEIEKDKDNCSLECKHKFHLSCIFQLYNQDKEFSNKCPLCRKEYVKNEPVELNQEERNFVISELRGMLARFMEHMENEMDLEEEVVGNDGQVRDEDVEREMQEDYIREIIMEETG